MIKRSTLPPEIARAVRTIPGIELMGSAPGARLCSRGRTRSCAATSNDRMGKRRHVACAMRASITDRQVKPRTSSRCPAAAK